MLMISKKKVTKMHNKRIQLLFTMIFLLILLILYGCSLEDNIQSVSANQDSMENNIVSEENEQDIPKEAELRITAVGDVMVHGPQLKAQYDEITGEYDFTNNFQYIRHYIMNADIALCNLETTLSGEEKKYSSYPRFNSPDSIINAIMDSGFDVVVTANNHTIDLGTHGVDRTLSILKEHGLQPLGTAESESENKFIIQEINNIKVGMIAYTYETPKFSNKRTINALVIPSDTQNRINTFNYDELELSLNEMKDEINKMRSLGAEVVIFYMHWGNEFQRQQNSFQEKIAYALSEYGADIILGSHPHVIQPIQLITSERTQKTTLVVYSMGNILSNQRFEVLSNRYTEDGIIVNITLKKNLQNKGITFSEISYIPTWVYKYRNNGKNVFEIIPLNSDLDKDDLFSLKSEADIWRAKNSKKNTVELIESNLTQPFDIPIVMEE